MSVASVIGRATVHHGDCLEVMPGLPLVDAVVTDPPYHLSSIVKRFGGANAAPAKDRDGLYQRASAGFMGQQWDGGDVAFRVDTWAKVFDRLKPGGHLCAFSATRTYHRMACAIEDAGFEIRDQLAWVYGSGFPKSHDVAKGIDKARGEDVEPVRAICRVIREAMDRKGLKSKHLAGNFGDCHPRLIDHWAARDTDSQPSLPTWEQWERLRSLLEIGDDHNLEVWRLNGRKGQPGDTWQAAPVIGEHDGEPGGFGDRRFKVRDNKIRVASDEASQWQGWGTALKPAWEPIVLARKPLDGTVAANVLAHGTGALNIDGCRVELVGDMPSPGGRGALPVRHNPNTARDASPVPPRPEDLGRFPANLIHDGSPEVLACFPRDAGAFAPVRGTEPSKPAKNVYGEFARGGGAFHNDSGSAARFFYCAKADADDRIESKHPTVKPIHLMRWLVRLVTPPGGVVLDPFAGTGTTCAAALREGFASIGIEREASFFADAQRRLRRMTGEDSPLFGAGADA